MYIYIYRSVSLTHFLSLSRVVADDRQFGSTRHLQVVRKGHLPAL